MSTEEKIVVALAGNPNSGKTTIFNSLTGMRQHVGNYPGVTVEKKDGLRRHKGLTIEIVDLPGTYGLSAHTLEEVVARDFVIEERPDVVVDILDASNLERNLYLATQFMEMGVKLVLVLNMMDVASARGIEFDVEQLSGLLGVPIVTTVGHKGRGMDDLLDVIVETATREGDIAYQPLHYERELGAAIARIARILEEREPDLSRHHGARWLALKLLEEDSVIREKVADEKVLERVDKSLADIEDILGEPAELLIADHRYGYISGACREAVRITAQVRHTASDKIDEIVCNRVLALPLFILLMYVTFHLTFTLGEAPMGWIESGFGWLGGFVSGLWPEGSESALRSLLVDGIISGVGGVIVFLPNILFLFFAIALLEDSGYMARAAFIMDRIMHRMGLHGKSFIPMLIGFGCTVPAVMATRTLENRRDRLTTMLVAPLMSCGARFPIYALIIPAFFSDRVLVSLGVIELRQRALVLMLIYVIGIVIAVVGARLLRSTVLKGESVPFVMELPPYRMPTLKSIVLHMWQRSWLYLKKAGTIILGVSVILWALQAYPKKTTYDQDYAKRESSARAACAAKVEALHSELGLKTDADTIEQTIDHAPAGLRRSEDRGEDRALVRLDDILKPYQEEVARIDQERAAEDLAYSVVGRIGNSIAPVIKPLGFDWRIGTALVGAFAAKELFVSQMGIVFAMGEVDATPGADETSASLRKQLQENYTPLQGFCIMLFCLISMPCVATIAVTRRESGSWGWALFQLVGLTVLAWAVTLVVYQAGMLLKIGV